MTTKYQMNWKHEQFHHAKIINMLTNFVKKKQKQPANFGWINYAIFRGTIFPGYHCCHTQIFTLSLIFSTPSSNRLQIFPPFTKNQSKKLEKLTICRSTHCRFFRWDKSHIGRSSKNCSWRNSWVRVGGCRLWPPGKPYTDGVPYMGRVLLQNTSYRALALVPTTKNMDWLQGTCYCFGVARRWLLEFRLFVLLFGISVFVLVVRGTRSR